MVDVSNMSMELYYEKVEMFGYWYMNIHYFTFYDLSKMFILTPLASILNSIDQVKVISRHLNYTSYCKVLQTADYGPLKYHV